MNYALGYATRDEFTALAQLDGASFGFQYAESELADVELDIDLDTILVARDGQQIVGVSAEVPFEMTLPGNARVDVTGLTFVSVEVTHRRRGIMRAMMEQQVRDCARRGSVAMILTASEGGIYPRFGYGVATTARKIAIERAAARYPRPVREHGVVRMISADARPLLAPIYDRWRRQTPGGLDRNERRWELQLLDRDYQRHGMSELFHLVHADGYLSYRVRTGSNDVGVYNVASVVDYAPCTPEAHAALWLVLLDMDLCGKIESSRIPLDDPLPLLLTDRRQVTTTSVADGLWVRPLDVCALLSARRYAVDVDARLHVRDELLGDATYHLQGGPDGASCERTDGPADVDLDVAALGAISLGGTRLAQLVRARQVRCDDRGLATRLDRAFLADESPQYGTGF